MEHMFTEDDHEEIISVLGDELGSKYAAWCQNNIEIIVDDWFNGKDYTEGDVIRDLEVLKSYIAFEFLKWVERSRV